MPENEQKTKTGGVKVKKIIDPHLKTKLVEKHAGLVNLKYKNELHGNQNRRGKYSGKTHKNLHRDLIGFARTKRRARYELINKSGNQMAKSQIQHGGVDNKAPIMPAGGTKKSDKLIDADVTTKEKFQSMTRSIAQTTGVSRVGNFIRSTTGRVGAFFDFNNPEASQIVEVEIAGRNLINTALAYKAYLLKMREALMVIDKKILTPIIVGSIKGKKGGELFNDGSTNSMMNKSTMKYLYRLANLRDNTYIDYIGKCSLSSLQSSKTRLKLVVDWFKKATGNLQPIDRYSGMRYRFFMCKLYKLREAELEFNFRLQQFTQSIKFISNLPAYQVLQQFIKFKTTEYNGIEYLDIKTTKSEFANYESQILKDIQSQKINTEAVDFQDSVLSKAYYKTLQVVPANIERVKWTVNKCIVIAYEIDSLQDEIFRSTGFAPNPELNFVLRTGATKRLKDNATRMAYFDRVNSINIRIDNYVQYLLQSIDTAVTYGDDESGKTSYQEIVDLREKITFLTYELNKISSYQSADVQKVQAQIRHFLREYMAQKVNVKESFYYPSNTKDVISRSGTLTDVSNNISTAIVKSDKSALFTNSGVLFQIWANETKLTEKLWNENIVITRSELQQIIGEINNYYTAKLREIIGNKPFDMQSKESMAQLGKDLSKMKLDFRQAVPVTTVKVAGMKGGEADFAESPNDNYPASMTILPFGYPDDVLTASTRITQGQCGGDGSYEVQRDEKQSVVTNVIDNTNPASPQTTTQQFQVVKISETSLKGFYRDLMFILNNPMFFESRGFFAKLGDFFTRATKTQKTKEIHRIYMNYLIKFEMGVLNFDDTSADGKTPSRFPTGTAMSGYPSFVMMKLYWQYLDLTQYTNYSDLAYLDFGKLKKIREEKKFMKPPTKYKYSRRDAKAGYDKMTGIFGNAATSNYGAEYAGIPPSFLQMGMINQDEVKAILSEDSLEAVKDIFKTAVYKLVNERINQIRQDDVFLEQMRKAGKVYQIRVLKPEVFEILNKWEKAITAKDNDKVREEVNKLKQYVIEDQQKELDTYLTTISSGTPSSGTTPSPDQFRGSSLYKDDPTTGSTSTLFFDNAVNDYTDDFNAIITSWTGGFRILYYMSATMSGKKYKYYDPDQVISDYQSSVSIPELSGRQGSAERRTDFNKYDEDQKMIIMGQFRAKFSMLRGADYNDTYFPISNENGKEGQIDTKYLQENQLVIETKTDEKSKLEIGKSNDFWGISWSFIRGFIYELPKWILKIGLRITNIFAILPLCIVLFPLCMVIFKDEESGKAPAPTPTSPSAPTVIPGDIITTEKSKLVTGRDVNVSIWSRIRDGFKKLFGTIGTAGYNAGKFLLYTFALIVPLVYMCYKLLSAKSTQARNVLAKLLDLGKLLKNKSPEEQKKVFDVNFVDKDLFWTWCVSEPFEQSYDEYMYRDYTLDKAEFAMANMYLYNPLSAHPKTGGTGSRYTDYSSVLGDMICKYMYIYYNKDANFPAFQKFVSRLKVGYDELAADSLSDSVDSTLHTLVSNLIGETDKHSKDVFGKFVLSANEDPENWGEKFKLAAIYMKDDTGLGYPRLSMIGISPDKLIKIFGKDLSGDLQLNAYYGENSSTLSSPPDRSAAQLSLLMQVLKLSGCVRLICCLHVIYKQFSNLENKIKQIETKSKGLAKDLSTDAVDELYSRLSNNAYSPGNFQDLRLFMDACGIKLIQYYRTRITELIARDRIELTGDTKKPEVQTVFNRTLTKLLMFLRLNLIFTDYIQFKTRIIRQNPVGKLALKNNTKTWPDIFEITSATTTSASTSITYTYVLFRGEPILTSTPSHSSPTEVTNITLNSVYPTLDTILDSSGKVHSYCQFNIVMDTIKYYGIGKQMFDASKSKMMNNVNRKEITVIVCANPSSPTQYTFYIQERKTIGNITSAPKYAPISGSGIDEISKFYSGKGITMIKPSPTTYTSPLDNIHISDDANNIYYTHPLYPSTPITVPTPGGLSGSPSTPVYYYPAVDEISGYITKGNTHKHFDDGQQYYVTIFPTHGKMSMLIETSTPSTTPIHLPTNINLAEYKTDRWTFSDFVWVPSSIGGISMSGGGGNSEEINQIGGAGLTCENIDKSDKHHNIACYLRNELSKQQVNIDSVILKINEIIEEQSIPVESKPSTGGQTIVKKAGTQKRHKLVSMYYLYKYLLSHPNDCNKIKQIAKTIYNFNDDIQKGAEKMQNQAVEGGTNLAADLSVTTINNLINDTETTDNFPVKDDAPNTTKYSIEKSYNELIRLANEKCQQMNKSKQEVANTATANTPKGNLPANPTANAETTTDPPAENANYATLLQQYTELLNLVKQILENNSSVNLTGIDAKLTQLQTTKADATKLDQVKTEILAAIKQLPKDDIHTLQILQRLIAIEQLTLNKEDKDKILAAIARFEVNEQKLTALQTQAEAMQTNLDENTKKLTALTEECAKLLQEKAVANQKIEEATAQLKQQGQNNTQLKGQLTAAQQALVAAEQKLTDAAAQITDLLTEIKKLAGVADGAKAALTTAKVAKAATEAHESAANNKGKKGETTFEQETINKLIQELKESRESRDQLFSSLIGKLGTITSSIATATSTSSSTPVVAKTEKELSKNIDELEAELAKLRPSISASIGDAKAKAEAEEKAEAEAKAEAEKKKEEKSEATPSTPVTAPTATTIPSKTTPAKYNFSQISKITPTPVNINIINPSDATNLFKQIDDIAAASGGATPPATPDNYYFVIGYVPSSTPTAYVITNIIDLTQYKNIKCIYAVSGGDTSKGTTLNINYMQADTTTTMLDLTIQGHSTTASPKSYIKIQTEESEA